VRATQTTTAITMTARTAMSTHIQVSMAPPFLDAKQLCPSSLYPVEAGSMHMG
jgi:hypothetical protein